MKFTRMLTTKLTSFWLMSLAAIAFVFLLSAMMSFVQLTYKFQQQKVSELESLLIEHYHSQPDWELESWLPPIERSAFRLSRQCADAKCHGVYPFARSSVGSHNGSELATTFRTLQCELV